MEHSTNPKNLHALADHLLVSKQLQKKNKIKQNKETKGNN